MIAQMDYLGVSHALLQCGRLYGRLNDFLSAVVREHPARFRASFDVDESDLDSRAQADEVLRCVNELGLTALYFSNDTFALRSRNEDFGAPQFADFWDTVAGAGIPVLWDVRLTQDRTEADYRREINRLHRFGRQHPSIRNVLTHGLPSVALADNTIHQDVLSLLRETNTVVELLFPLLRGASSDYPFREVWPIIRELYKRLGDTKLLWGSDMPNVERTCTYRQSLTYLTSYCTFLPALSIERIVDHNARELYFGGGRQ